MAIVEQSPDIELASSCESIARRARAAARRLGVLPTAAKNRWLKESAAAIRANVPAILAANALDVAAAPGFGLDAAAIDRLSLDAKRIESIAKGMDEVAALPDPVGEQLEQTIRPNGLDIRKIRVPLGVVFFIYESRPNVTADAAAICVKSGNAVILRGGKEAAHSSRVLVELLQTALIDCDLPADAVQIVGTADRAAVGHFLKLSQYIDVAIPRGGEGLIRRVVAEARMPVLKHFDGNCHVYVDRAADAEMAERIVINSKTHRYGVCNAAESLLIHADIAESFLPRIAAALGKFTVEIRGDARTCDLIPTAVAVTERDYAAEFLGPIISCRVVDSLDDALDHIERYGSKHTDTIVTDDATAAATFLSRVDSAAVMHNASTRFNDGGEFGLGAEIGISTDKFHARGPCGLKELTTYKYVVHGNGQIRT